MQIDVGPVCCTCSASVSDTTNNVCHKCSRLVCSMHHDWVWVHVNACNYIGIEGVDVYCASFAHIRACQDCQREEKMKNALLWAFFFVVIIGGAIVAWQCGGGCGSDSTFTLGPTYKYHSDYYDSSDYTQAPYWFDVTSMTLPPRARPAYAGLGQGSFSPRTLGSGAAGERAGTPGLAERISDLLTPHSFSPSY